MMSRDKSKILTKGTIPRRVENSMLGMSVSSAGANDTSITGIRYAWASLKLRAKEHIAKRIALKNAAKITSNGKI